MGQQANLAPLPKASTMSSIVAAFQKHLASIANSPRKWSLSRLAALLGRTELPGREELAELRLATRVLILGLAAWIALVALVTIIAVVSVELSTMGIPAWFDLHGSSSVKTKPHSNGSYDSIINRPLFSRIRQVSTTIPKAVPPPSALGLERDISLKGVFINGKQAKAFLVSAQNPRGTWVETGGEIAGWKVVSLKAEEVVLEGQNDRLTIALTNKGPSR